MARLVLELSYGRTFPCSEPNVDKRKWIEVQSFRALYSHLEITLGNGQLHYLNKENGLVYYDKIWWADVKIMLVVNEAIVIERFDPNLSSLNRVRLPIEHTRITEAIELLRDVIKVDGETMQHILEEVGMDEQMGSQLDDDSEAEEMQEEIDRLYRRLLLVTEDVVHLLELVEQILTKEVLLTEDSDGASIYRLINNIGMAADITEDDVDDNWADPRFSDANKYWDKYNEEQIN